VLQLYSHFRRYNHKYLGKIQQFFGSECLITSIAIGQQELQKDLAGVWKLSGAQSNTIWPSLWEYMVLPLNKNGTMLEDPL
jgi:hypothetical protein